MPEKKAWATDEILDFGDQRRYLKEKRDELEGAKNYKGPTK